MKDYLVVLSYTVGDVESPEEALAAFENYLLRVPMPWVQVRPLTAPDEPPPGTVEMRLFANVEEDD